MDFIFNVILALVGFSFLILIHEFGHFIVAKKLGIGVEAFSLGFGPHIGKKWHGTEYRLSLIPLGGYVKLAGEEPKPGCEAKPNEFYGRPPGHRAAVLLAGAGMNILFAILAFIVAFGLGVKVVPALVGGTIPGSPAWEQGLEQGDRILSINGRTAPLDFEDLTMATVLSSPKEGIRLVIQRGDAKPFPVTLRPRYEEDLGIQRVGVRMPSSMKIARVIEVEGVDRVAKAGLKVGDRIVMMGVKHDPDKPAKLEAARDPFRFDEAILDCAGKPIVLAYERKEKGPDGREVTKLGRAVIQPGRADPSSTGRLFGLSLSSNVVSDIRPKTWLGRSGLAKGDRLTHVAGKPVIRRGQIEAAFKAAAGKEVPIVFERAGEDKGDAKAATPADVVQAKVLAPTDVRLERVVGFERLQTVDNLVPGFPAEAFGLRPGDRMLSFNEQAIEKQVDLHEAVAAAGAEPVTVCWERGGQVFVRSGIRTSPRWMCGIAWAPDQVSQPTDPLTAITLGTRKAVLWAVRIYQTLAAVATHRVAARHLGGPIAIAQITYAAARHGIPKLIYFLGLISINLGLINLLPIPILDGGHMVFVIAEKLRGKPVNERFQIAASYVGLSLIVALFLFTTFNDIWRNFFGP